MWIYVYGNGKFIWTILTSVNIFMNNATTFFKLAATISLLLFAFDATGILPTRGYNWTRFIKVYGLLALFVLTPYKGDINVQDVITNDNYTFSGSSNSKLPLGLVLPISTVSVVMNKLINLYQRNFAIDSNLNYTYSGMNFGANFILGLDSVNSYDDKFDTNLDNYMQNCGFPLLRKAGKIGELRTSNDIIATLKANTSDARFVQQVDFNSGNPIVKSCTLAIESIDAYYTAQQDKFFTANATMSGVDPKLINTRYLNAAQATSRDLLNITTGVSTALKQAIAMNMIMTSIKNGAQAVGNGSLALSVYDAEQFQQYKKTGELSGSASARTIPILVASGFALLFFLYPVMIFLAVAMGSYKAIGVFFQILVALNLIPLLYEILNYLSTYYLQQKLHTTIIGSGFNYDVSTSLYSFTDNMIVAGNYLATSAPLIAYAIVSGSAVALTSVFGHINDPAKSQSQEVGRELSRGNWTSGNVSMDNASFNNLQGNKFDDQLMTNSGVPVMKNTNSGGTNTNIGGQNYDSNHKSDLLVAPQLVQLASHSLQNNLSHSMQEMNQLSKQWGNQQQKIHDLSNSLQSDSSSTSVIGTDDAKNLHHLQDLATTVQAQLGGGKILSGSIGISSSLKDSLDNNISEYSRVSSQLAHSSNQGIRDVFSNTDTLTNQTLKTVSDTFVTSQTINDLKSTQSTVTSNLVNSFDSYMRDNGYDPTLTNQAQQTALAQQFVEQKINGQSGIKDILQNPSNINDVSINHAPNADGLQNPNLDGSITTHGNQLHEKSEAQMIELKNNQGNLLGKQLKEQGKTAVNVGKNIVQGGETLVDSMLQYQRNLKDGGK